MKVATSLADVDVSHPSVVSVGNFDGLHRGHQEILKTVVARAREQNLQSIAMTFAPHPIRFLAPDRAPRLISTMDQKIRLIGNTGVDLLFAARFDEAFSRLTPETFIQQYLIGGFKCRSICVGGNFNFGYRGTGTIETLRRFQSQFEIVEVPPVFVRGMLASSTHVRQLVANGHVSRACRLLGRWFEIEGNIVSGAGRGRTMKVPTINLDSENELIPKTGVYITRISLDGGAMLKAVTNIGVRPTFNESGLTIETFVLTGPVPERAAAARIEFIHRLRDEMKFPSPEALRRQIDIDVRRAQRFFASPAGRGKAERAG